MTIEDRARECAAKTGADVWPYAIEAIEQALRDQIEDCAQIANTHHAECSMALCVRRHVADTLADQIRDLAMSCNQTEDGLSSGQCKAQN